jgi:hypothetical protein
MATSYSNPAFAEVEPDSFSEELCTPEIVEGFEGLALAAPETVFYDAGQENPLTGAFADIIVCGVVSLPYDTQGLEDVFLYSIILTAIDQATRKKYTGQLSQTGTSETDDPTLDSRVPMEIAEGEEIVITDYFNPNLTLLLDLPEQDAEYLVYATVGPYKSNQVRIRVKANPPR